MCLNILFFTKRNKNDVSSMTVSIVSLFLFFSLYGSKLMNREFGIQSEKHSHGPVKQIKGSVCMHTHFSFQSRADVCITKHIIPGFTSVHWLHCATQQQTTEIWN